MNTVYSAPSFTITVSLCTNAHRIFSLMTKLKHNPTKSSNDPKVNEVYSSYKSICLQLAENILD